MNKHQREQQNKERFIQMSLFEHELFESGYRLIGGIDEAGRGPLAGPVVASTVILKHDILIDGLNDSKKVSPSKRQALYDIIIDNSITYGLGIEEPEVIDDINILEATKRAMRVSIDSLFVTPDYLLLDAVELKDLPCKSRAIIKGDSLSISIAAASILAKVTRDRIMDKLDEQYPMYGFKKHKGYGTAEHIAAIKKYGICPIHRKSFTKNFV